MAKINFTSPSSDGFAGEVTLAVNDAKTKATLGYDGLSSIQFFGDGLKGTAEGALKAGTVDKIIFTNADGDQAIVVTGHYKAVDIASAPDAESIFFSLFDGNDTITGSNGNDMLTNGGRGDDIIFGKGGTDAMNGGRGNDILTGGGGADGFIFTAQDGKGQDIITDFDTLGNNADILSFNDVSIENYVKAGGGDDTKIILDNGATILLEDVTRAEFKEYLVTLV